MPSTLPPLYGVVAPPGPTTASAPADPGHVDDAYELLRGVFAGALPRNLIRAQNAVERLRTVAR